MAAARDKADVRHAPLPAQGSQPLAAKESQARAVQGSQAQNVQQAQEQTKTIAAAPLGKPAPLTARLMPVSRHSEERYAPLLPSRGGAERVDAYTQYLVLETRECRHRLGKERAGRIARALLASADRHGLDPRLLTAMVQRESDFNPDETSHCGAKGLGQLTHWDDGGVDCYNIEANLAQSAKNLKSLLKQFGSPELALAAYNAGEDKVRQYHGIPPYSETRAHVRVVMGIYRRVSAPTRKIASVSRKNSAPCETIRQHIAPALP